MATVPTLNASYPAGSVIQQADMIGFSNACNFLLQKPMVKVVDTIGGQSLPVGTAIPVSFDTPAFDTDGLWQPQIISRDYTSTTAIGAAVSSLTISWSTFNPTPGATVIVAFSQNATTVPTSVKDNGATQSTFTLDASNTGSTTEGIWIYRANGISLPSGGGTYSVTITMNGSHNAAAVGQSYVNVQPGTAINSSTGSNSGSTSVSTGAVAIRATSSLFFAAFNDKSALNPETVTLTGSGFSTVANNLNGSGGQILGTADQIVTGASSQTCTWTLGDTVGWNAAMVEYVATETYFFTIQTPGWYKVRYGVAVKNSSGGNYNAYVNYFLGANNPGNGGGAQGSFTPPFYGSYATYSAGNSNPLMMGAAGIIPYYLYSQDAVQVSILAGNVAGGTTSVSAFNGSNNAGSYFSLEYVSTT